jgi:Flp pilus assembly protein TadG
VIVVLVAATMAALLVVVALVVDLGGARNARAKDQNIADAVALAGAAKLDPTGGNNQAACTAAWAYMVTNTSVASTPAPSCVTMAGTCVATTARQVSITRGDLVVTFTNPVPAGDTLFSDQSAQAADGSACQRFGVTITQTWHNVIEAGSTTVQASAIARFAHGPGDVNAPLIVLDPHACQALTVTGHSHVTTTTSTGDPGYVAIDSDGTGCPAGNKVIVDATGDAEITAGAIAMWALTTGNTARAYDPADVGVGRAINPAPIPSSAPVGRTSVDWRYNCSAASACPGAGPAAIDQLVAADGAGTPTGFTRWTSVYSCSPSADFVVAKGNWYIDCPSGLSTSAKVTFRGGNIVADGPFNMGGNGALRINCDVATPATACPSDPASPTTLFIRSGGLTKSGNVDVTLLETFVYLASGTVSLTGTGTLNWTAPNDSSSSFDDLLFWNESSVTMSLVGDTDTVLEGIFFAPNAALALTGNTGSAGLGSQMFVQTASLTGNSELTLAPKTDRVMQLGSAGSALIR